jgi:hypothetical protein
MSRQEIRELISEATDLTKDPTRCLESRGWVFAFNEQGGRRERNAWAKNFTLPCSIHITEDEQDYFYQKVIIQLCFTSNVIIIRLMPQSEHLPHYSLYSYYFFIFVPDLQHISLILQKLADGLPKAIVSAETEPFYDEAKQKQVEVIPYLKLENVLNDHIDSIRKDATLSNIVPEKPVINPWRVRERVSKVIFSRKHPNRCLEPWGWTFIKQKKGGAWYKVYSPPHPLQVLRFGRICFYRKVIVCLNFYGNHVSFRMMPYPESEGDVSLYGRVITMFPFSHTSTMVSALEMIADKLPVTVSSVVTESYYDKKTGQEIDFIPMSRLTVELTRLMNTAQVLPDKRSKWRNFIDKLTV